MSQSETPQNPATDSESQSEDLASLLQELYALPLSQRHVESDGLVLTQHRLQNVLQMVWQFLTEIISISFLIHKCLLWKKKLARNLPIGGQPVQSHSNNTKPSSPEKTSSTPSSTIKPKL